MGINRISTLEVLDVGSARLPVDGEALQTAASLGRGPLC